MMTRNILSNNKNYLIVILCVTFLCFSSTLNSELLNWDDTALISTNPDVKALNWYNISQIFSNLYVGTYIPLTVLSFAVEHQFFGDNPFIYHFNNLLLHLGVVALIFILSLKLGLSLRATVLATLLFAIHPMHVESVAWVTQRKDVLYSLFYMLALCQYWDYLRTKRIENLFFCTVLGILSLLSKPMALSLPLILLLLDWFKGRRIDGNAIIEKIPLIFIAAAIVYKTYSVYSRIPGDNLLEAGLIWVWCYSFYIKQFLLPLVSVPIYLLPEPVSLMGREYLISIVIFVSTIILLFKFKTNKWFMFGFLFQFLSIFFLLRFDYGMDLNVVADRFMYLPSLGYCLFIGVLIDKSFQHCPEKGLNCTLVKTIIYVALFLTLGTKTFIQGNIWKNSVTLWSHTIKHLPNHVYAYGNRAAVYGERGQFDLALKDYTQALKIAPEERKLYFSRGDLFLNIKEYDKAIDDFNRAIEIDEEYLEAYFKRGVVYQELNNFNKANKNYKKVIAINPKYDKVYYNLGLLFDDRKYYQAAINYFSEAIQLEPRNLKAYNNRGVTYLKMRRYDSALKDFAYVVEKNPNNAVVFNNLGVLYFQKKDTTRALKSFSKAIQINPHYSQAINNRKAILMTMGENQ